MDKPVKDHHFHPLRVKRIVEETSDTVSFVLDVPPGQEELYSYEAGQFCTFRVRLDGNAHLRCYSMSSSPAVDTEMQVTVKRVAGGLVSNWMIDTLSPEDIVEVTPPAGVFCLAGSDENVVAFAGGSGITPVFSIMKTVLATTSRRVRLLYANREASAVIFAGALAALAEQYPDRLTLACHLDSEQGLVTDDEISSFVEEGGDAEFYICGPQVFMEVIEETLLARGVLPDHIHVERFTPLPAPEPIEQSGDHEPISVTIELEGRTDIADYRPGTTILQTARQLGMAPPFSCESGNCATCMAKLVDGAVTMHVNNALTEQEVAEGWILTCQAVPTTSSVGVIYGYGDD